MSRKNFFLQKFSLKREGHPYPYPPYLYHIYERNAEEERKVPYARREPAAAADSTHLV